MLHHFITGRANRFSHPNSTQPDTKNIHAANSKSEFYFPTQQSLLLLQSSENTGLGGALREVGSSREV